MALLKLDWKCAWNSPSRQLRRSVAVFLIGLAAGCSALPETTETGERTVLTDVPVNEHQMLTLLNSYRTNNGQQPLQLDQTLNEVSQDMARHIAMRDSMDTRQHSASGLSRRLDRAGYANYAGAENLGAGYADLPAAFRGWQGSKGHNKNLLNPYVTRVGIARTNRNTGKWRNFWVMTLSRPSEDGRPNIAR